jgi:hypothetical protein
VLLAHAAAFPAFLVLIALANGETPRCDRRRHDDDRISRRPGGTTAASAVTSTAIRRRKTFSVED